MKNEKIKQKKKKSSILKFQLFFLKTQHHCPGTPCILVGTKTDLRKGDDDASRVVSRQQAEQLKNELKLHAALECSALTQQGLGLVFDEAARVAIGASKDADKVCF